MLAFHGGKGELWFAMRSRLRLSEKHNKVGMFLLVDEQQDRGLLIAETRDPVLAGLERLAGGHERKWHLHQNLIRALSLRRNSEACEAGQDKQNAQE